MARILAYTTPRARAPVPLIPILAELRRRGHQVALRTLAAEVTAMRARGFDAGPISDRIEAIGQARPDALLVDVNAWGAPAVRVPANARMERFLPHGLVLDRALCAVTHGAWAPPKGTGPRRAGVRRPLRTRPAGGRPAGGGGRRGHAAARKAPTPRPAARQGARGDPAARGRQAHPAWFAAAGGSSAAADAFETLLLHRELPQKLPS
jgi:hypothetical protein